VADDPFNEENFSKRRRNLIVVSLIVCLAEILKLRFTKLNLLGNEFVIGDPGAVTTALWVSWGYFVLRYWQAFKELPAPRFAERFNQETFNLMMARAFFRARRHARSFENAVQDSVDPAHPPKVDVVGHHLRALSSTSRYMYYEVPPAMRGGTHGAPPGPLPPQHGYLERQFEIRFGWSEILYLRLRAFLTLGVNTSVVTEQLLPFGFALLPVLARLS
jgi:hypothetical protein